MNRSSTAHILLAGTLACAVATGCATTDSDGVTPDYDADAEINLKRGLEALESRNFIEAEKYFEYVRSKYPFLDAANIAELKLADTDFEQEQYSEARDRYQNFVKLHPTHPQVHYAAFRAALTHYKDIPSDFFLLPNPREKDQAEIRATLTSMEDFLRQYPKSEHVPEAKRIAEEVRRRLAEHELYVADFYRARKRWPAVVNRLKVVVTRYPGIFDEQAYFGMYDAYLALKDPERAQETLRTIIEKMPGTPAASRAKKLLGG